MSAHHKLAATERLLAAKKGKPDEWKRYDGEFHRALISNCGSRALLDAHAGVFDRVSDIRCLPSTIEVKSPRANTNNCWILPSNVMRHEQSLCSRPISTVASRTHWRPERFVKLVPCQQAIDFRITWFCSLARQDARAWARGRTGRRNIAFRVLPGLRGIP